MAYALFLRLQTAKLNERLKQAAELPANPEKQQRVAKVLIEARQKAISISATVIEQAGTRLIEAAKREPETWETVQILLNYLLSVYGRPKWQ